jgi:N-acetylglucosamine-6-sulfatase
MRIVCRLVCAALLLALAGPPSSAAQAVAAKPAAQRPNILFVMVDDLEAGDLQRFPNIWGQLVRQGTSFDRFFTTNSWCCPSRATVLRSQYVHSHDVTSNQAPEGGFHKFHTTGLERSTIGTWLQSAGYRTALMGKYLNHYPANDAPPAYVPPGWDEWNVPVRRLYHEYDYTLNENGTLREYGWTADDHLTDVLSRKAVDFVSREGDKPFFLYLAPVAPHSPANCAHRHCDAFPGAKAPRAASFDQDDVSAEPRWLRAMPKLTKKQVRKIDNRYRDRLRAMLAVDDMVGALVDALRRTGRLDDTYVVFTSDNGWHQGEHRLPMGKSTPFEEAVRVPLVVRGPGVPAARTVDALTSTVDLAPTFAELGGAAVPYFAEGRSLLPLLGTEPPPTDWRKNILVEFKRPASAKAQPYNKVPTYQVLRTDRYSYIRYETGERQLYDMKHDPAQLRNLAAKADPRLLADLDRRLDDMHTCAGPSCRVADAAGPPPAY